MKKILQSLLCLLLAACGLVSCTTPPEESSTSESESQSASETTTQKPEPEIELDKYERRMVFISDIHYNLENDEIVNFGQAVWNNPYGMTADARAQYFVDLMIEEYEKAPEVPLYIFILGDLTSAEYGYQYFDPDHAKYKGNDPRYDLNGDGRVDLEDYNFSKYDAISVFKETYIDQLTAHPGIKVFCTPGNHDTYQNSAWKNLFDYADAYRNGSPKSADTIVCDPEEAEYAIRVNADTAVLLLNAFNENRGAMTGDRNPSNGKDESFLLGNQQTLSYTSSDLAKVRGYMDAIVAAGYKNVYIASHFATSGDVTLQTVVREYDCIRGIFYGDAHQDTFGTIDGVPTFCDGHFSQSMMWGDTGDLDQKKLPFSYITLERTENTDKVSFHKTEGLYLGLDNKAYLEAYFTLTEVTNASEIRANRSIISLTTPNIDKANNRDLSTLAYYRYVIRKDLSETDALLAARLQHFLDEYDMGIRLVTGSTTNTTGCNYNYSYLSFQRKYLAESFYEAGEVVKTKDITIERTE